VDVIENEAGQRCAKDAGERQAGQEERDCLRLFPLPEPVGEVEDNSGEVASFGKPEKKAKYIKLGQILDEARQSCEKSPRDDDAGQPDASTKFVQQKVAGNFEQKVADEKDSGQQAELLGGDAEIAVHGKRSKPNVDAIEK
jgi:hypothetical protein